MPQFGAIIAGTGSALPDRRLTNADLEKMVETSDDWIFQRTGMRERRIAARTGTRGLGAFAQERSTLRRCGLKFLA